MFGLTILLSNPELKDKIILCNQGIDGGNINLKKRWSLPKLDSTLNIHMLPIAATLTKNINLLGVDGQSKEIKKNEDFWAHSKIAQMHDLVETGHLSHPTFAANREFRKDLNISTIDRFSESCRVSLNLGLNHGKNYKVLNNTFTDSLKPFVGKEVI